MTHPRLAEITERIRERSDGSRRAYLQRIDDMRANGPMRGRLVLQQPGPRLCRLQ